MDTKKSEQIERDRQTILSLGGPTKVAQLLGLDKLHGGAQRVQNWMRRGIPPQVKLDHPDLFLPDLCQANKKRPNKSSRNKKS
jgi:hypothetical protein